MQTISIIKRTCTLLVSCLLVAPLVASAAERRYVFDAGAGESICLKTVQRGYKKFAPCDSPTASIKPDNKTSQLFQTADDVIPLFGARAGEKQQLLLLARTPSTRQRSTGFCGAGHEDSLVLVELVGTRMVLKDRLLVQSCLKSIALESDQGDDPERAFSIDRSAGELRFRWLGDTPGSTRVVKVANASLGLQQKNEN